MANLISMQQVHGNRVTRVGAKDKGRKIPNCDGLITNENGLELAVNVADCLPIFLNDPVTNSYGVLHAGWRGLESGIIKNEINLMQSEFGTNPQDLSIYIGPHICAKHYEVKEDVASKFRVYGNALKTEKKKMFLDLSIVAKEQLVVLGVKKENIKEDLRCTFKEKNLVSYRRGDKGKSNSFSLKS